MKRKDSAAFRAAAVRTLIVLAFLAAWEYTARHEFYNPFYTSFPSRIVLDLAEFYSSGALFRHASITLEEAFLALVYGSVSGVALGVLFGQFVTLGRIFTPILTAISSIPQLTLAPVYVLWFGLGLTSKIFLASLMVFFSVFFATYNAIRNMDQKLIEAASLLGAGKLRILWHVVLPTCMPWILSGIRGGVGACLIGAIIGEYMGASGGFGWMIAYATSYFKIQRVMSCILILLVVGVVLNKLLDMLERGLLQWRPETRLSLDVERKAS